MLIKTIRNPWIFILFLFFFNTIYTQNEGDSIKFRELDNIYKQYLIKNPEKSYEVYHEFLKESAKLYYKKGINTAYKKLMWYHGSNKKKNLDSVLYYADLFELQKKYNNSSFRLVDSVELSNHYINKGELLANSFGLPQQGLECYFKAYTFIPKNDMSLLIDYQIGVSQIYIHKSQFDKALVVLNPILKDTASIKISKKIVLLQTIALCYAEKNIPEKSHFINKKILELAIKNNKKNSLLWTKNEISFDYFMMGQYNKAINLALEVRAKCIEDNYHEPIYNNSIFLCTYYKAIGEFDKAISYGKKAAEYPGDIGVKMNIYNMLADCYIKKMKYRDAIEIFNQKDAVIDSLRSLEEKTLTSYIGSNIKLLKEEQKNQKMVFDVKLLEENNKKQRLYLFNIITVLLCICLMLCSILIFRKYRKGEKEIEILKINEKILLEEKIVLRENEIEASAIALSQRLETLYLIKNELKEIKTPKIQKLEEVKIKINKLIQSSSDMSIINKRIESEYPTISAKLMKKHPNLSTTELRYCLLTKLNLSLKETGLILNVAPNTVKVARNRIKNKLDISKGMSIKTYLDQFI